MRLIKLLSDGKNFTLDFGMKYISLKGGILIIPEDWIVVNPEDAGKFGFASLLTVSQHEKRGVPVFVRFNDEMDGRFPDTFNEEFIRMCIDLYPNLKNEFNTSSKRDFDMEGNCVNYYDCINDELIILAIDTYDSFVDDFNNAPYGAMIVRNNE